MWPIAIIPFVIALLFAWIGRGQYRHVRNDSQAALTLHEHGVKTEATIISKRKEVQRSQIQGKARTFEYPFITYRFETPTGAYTRVIPFDRDDYDEVNEGDKITVWYLPSSPDTVMTAQELEDDTLIRYFRNQAYGAFAVAAVMVLVAGVIAAIIILDASSPHRPGTAPIEVTNVATSAGSQ